MSIKQKRVHNSLAKKLQTPGEKPAAISRELFEYLDKLPYPEQLSPERELYNTLREDHRPIIYKDTARVIELLVLLHRPLRILEIGTHSGYSTICLNKHLGESGFIHTIEFRVDHIAEAMVNIANYGKKEQVVFYQGKALDVLNSLLIEETYDLIFIDADKQSYPEYLSFAQSHLSPKGLVLVDNLLWKGAVFSSDTDFREKPSTKTIAEFNESFVKMSGFHTQILPVGDGLGIAIKF